MLDVISPLLVAVVGALTVWYADACRRGTVRRQWILGYRTALTMRDANAWTTVHRAMAPPLYAAGAGAALGGLACTLLALVGATGALPAVLGGSLVWLLLGVVLSGLPAAAAARAYQAKRTTYKSN